MLAVKILLIAGSLLLSGCMAPLEFYWPGPGSKTAQEQNRDGYECERDIRMAAGRFRPASSNATPGNEFAAEIQMRRMFQDCMEARGWRVKGN